MRSKMWRINQFLLDIVKEYVDVFRYLDFLNLMNGSLLGNEVGKMTGHE